MKTLDPKLLDEIVRRLVDEFDPEQIYLFGSHAWGTPHEDSDVDLCVVVRESDETESQRMFRAQRSLGKLLAPIDVLVKTRSQIEHLGGTRSTMEYEATAEGRLVYDCKARTGAELVSQSE